MCINWFYVFVRGNSSCVVEDVCGGACVYNVWHIGEEEKMKIRIYNENGTVRVAKLWDNGKEVSMFSNIKNGQAVTIEVGASVWINSHFADVIKEGES